MQILALNPYHGGSHRTFLDGWAAHSRHGFTKLTLPAYKWKWRMRHAALTLAGQAALLAAQGHRWDALFCTDMLNLAEFRGLSAAALAHLPAVAYFHENQLTYPARQAADRDLHFAFSNLITATSADAVWFNSAFHREEFLTALDALLHRMPDYQPLDVVATLRSRATIHPPGISPPPPRPARPAGPLRILWVSRWEHDKDPDTFFAALKILARQGCDFRVSVLGESFAEAPACFNDLRAPLAAHIDHWGYVADRVAYNAVLAASDVVVSTAQHEFFGIGIVEAVAAGCFPLVPRRLAYPEVLGDDSNHFHDGTPAGLATRLQALAEEYSDHRGRTGRSPLAAEVTQRYAWPRRAAELDAALEDVARGHE